MGDDLGRLVELEQHDVALWDIIADSLLIWCRRGVDGFRCDAGYKIPVPAWQYIIARVQDEFPETIFLLEGLGGSWEATEALLTEGGMQWAYSELFQNYSGRDVAWYLDYADRQSERAGSYVHYSETHDNDRLAKKGRAWSLLRNRLCALASPSGGFGFTCGVEWLATEKILVHGCTGLDWDSADNIVPELAQLNRLISDHPCFFDGAKLTRLSAPDSPVYALLRESAEGKDSVLVLVNSDVEKENSARHFPNSEFKIQNSKSICSASRCRKFPPPKTKSRSPSRPARLLPRADRKARRLERRRLPPCPRPGRVGAESLNKIIPAETIDGLDWRWLAEQVERSPKNFLAAAAEFAARDAKTPLADLLPKVEAGKIFPRVVEWTLIDRRRVTLVPPGHGCWFRTPRRSAPRFKCGVRSAERGMKIRAQSTFNPYPPAMSTLPVLRREKVAGGRRIDFGALRRHVAKCFRRDSFSALRLRAPHSALRTPMTWSC